MRWLIAQQEWCLLSYKFLWKEHNSQQTTPERDFALWVMAGCKSSILPTPRSFPCSGTFCMLSLSTRWFQFKRCGVQTDGTYQDRNSRKDEWASWRCCVDFVGITSDFIDSKPPTLSLWCDSWDKQWLQEQLSPSFTSWRTGLLGRSVDVMGRVLFESVADALPVRGLLLQQQIMEPKTWSRNEIERIEDGLVLLLTCWTEW